MDWFLYDNGLRHERVNLINYSSFIDHYSQFLDEPKKMQPLYQYNFTVSCPLSKLDFSYTNPFAYY